MSFTRARLISAVLGLVCLVHFPSFYKIVASSLIFLKLAVTFSPSSASNILFSFFIRMFRQIDIGWFFVTSVSPLIILRVVLKSGQHLLTAITLLLDRFESETKIPLRLMLLIEIIGVVFLLDNDLRYTQTFFHQTFIRVNSIWLRKENLCPLEAHESSYIDNDTIQVLDPPRSTAAIPSTPSTCTTSTPSPTHTPPPSRSSRSRSPRKKATNTNHVADTDPSLKLGRTPSPRKRYFIDKSGHIDILEN